MCCLEGQGTFETSGSGTDLSLVVTEDDADVADEAEAVKAVMVGTVAEDIADEADEGLAVMAVIVGTVVEDVTDEADKGMTTAAGVCTGAVNMSRNTSDVWLEIDEIASPSAGSIAP